MLLLVYLLGVVDWLLIGWLVALMYYVFHSVFVDVLFRLVFLLVFLFVCLVCGVWCWCNTRYYVGFFLLDGVVGVNLLIGTGV